MRREPDDIDVRYDALCERNERFDGVFFYGVQTTGVFCRPSCKSRTPLRKNVTFFTSADDALAQGFRPCKRCKPQSAASTIDPRFVALCRAIEQAEDLPTLQELARISGLSAAHVQRKFKEAIGVSPKAFAQTIKRERLRRALRTTASATQAIYEAGLSSSSQAYDTQRDPLGMTPAQFARGAGDVTIAYAIVESAIGNVLVAATPRGVCRVDIDDDARALEQRLRAEYPNAQLRREDGAMTSTTSLIVDYIAGTGPWPQLPLDVRGTAFQTRVWQALREIAPGKAQTYTELARAIGSPQSARAVATACAANSIALLIPCHRIVSKSGGVGGYRWDPKRKEHLLDIERRSTGN